MIRMFILSCMAFLFIGVVNAQVITEDSLESEAAQVSNQEDNEAEGESLTPQSVRRSSESRKSSRAAQSVETSTGTDKFTDEEWKRLTKEGGKEIKKFNKLREEEHHEFQAGLKKERKAFFESSKDLKGKERGKAISGFNQRQKEKRQAFHQAQKEKRKAFIKERKGAKAGVRKQRKEKKAEMRHQQKKERKQFHKKSPKRHGGPPKSKGPASQASQGGRKDKGD